MKVSYSPRTYDYYYRLAWRYLMDNPRPLHEHTEQDVVDWLERHTAYRSSARVTYFNALRCLFSWAARHGYAPADITRDLKVPSPVQKVPRALTEEQYEAVRRAAFHRHPMRGYTVELFYHSAGRLTEIRMLTWDDLTDEGIVFRHTKNGKERVIPWSPGLRRATEGLRGFFGEQTHVLPRCGATITGWFSLAGKEAGVARVHPHLFRSTAATRMLVRGARVHGVREVLGHAKLTTTQIYLATSLEDMQQAVGLL
jgi:integrase/recombinase XerC